MEFFFHYFAIRFEHMTKTIEESKDLIDMTINELYGLSVAHENLLNSKKLVVVIEEV